MPTLLRTALEGAGSNEFAALRYDAWLKRVGRIGLATAKPAEFIVLRFSQDTRALEEELAGAA